MLRSGRQVLLLSPYDEDLWIDFRTAMADPDWVTAPFGIEGNLAAAAQRIVSNAPATFDLVCHCAGAHLAFEIVRSSPGRIRAIALINASAAPDSDAGVRARRERITKLASRAARQSFPDASYLDFAVPWMLSAVSRQDRIVVGKARALLAAVPLERSLAQQRALWDRPDAHALLSELMGPILLIGGKEDRICGPELTYRMAAAAPLAQCAILDGCGHLVPIEAPMALAKLLSAWRKARI